MDVLEGSQELEVPKEDGILSPYKSPMKGKSKQNNSLNCKIAGAIGECIANASRKYRRNSTLFDVPASAYVSLCYIQRVPIVYVATNE